MNNKREVNISRMAYAQNMQYFAVYFESGQ